MAKDNYKDGYTPEMIPRIDPTANVLKLVEEAVKRSNDLFSAHITATKELREADEKLRDYQIKTLKEVAKINEKHAKELRDTETGRLDSIRQVDQVNATNTAASLALAIQTLSSTATTNADNLRNALTATATAMAKTTADLAATIATQQSIRDENINKRITSLEQSTYVNVGKEKVSDPLLASYMADIKELLSKRSEGIGAKNLWGLIFGGIMLLIAVITFLSKTGAI